MFCRPLTSSTFGSGLSFVNALVPGVLRFAQAQAESPPAVFFRTSGAYLADSNNFELINFELCYVGSM